jgi:sporulation protein YlmC with PRC-barrel domain
MLLTSLIGKRIFSNATQRGVCTGIGISLKTHAVKYLLCSNETEYTRPRCDFALPFSCIESIDEFAIHVSKTRAVFPKTCAQLFLQKPIFSYDGSFIGKLFDGCLTLEKSGEFTAVSLQTDDNQTVLVSSIYSVLDAVILRKNRVYPLGQRIPAPVLSLLGQQNQPNVTKTVLQRAIEKNNLITLTLSLPPFNQVLR